MNNLNNNHTNTALLVAQNVSKTFTDAQDDIAVLKSVSLTVQVQQSIAIVGASGSGKSTLLHILGGLDLPTSGDISLLGQHYQQMDETERGQLRNLHLGFVYQFHHLLPEFTALENVCMPLLLRQSCSVAQAQAQAEECLSRVGLAARLSHKPATLSGGERQRVAIARAIVTKPKILLADEPTGNLDTQTANDVFGLINELKSQLGMSILMVTHDLQLAQKADTILRMVDGTLLQPNCD